MGLADDLGDRMKRHELASAQYLPVRMPWIVRVDGKAFHTLTRGMKRPFDDSLGNAMVYGALDLCDEIQGAVLAYTQSDEISVLVHNTKTLNQDVWFGGNVQKVCSVAASVASLAVTDSLAECDGADYHKRAMFDARVFALPEEEVANYFLWRQMDAERNSTNQLAQSVFSAKQLHGVGVLAVREMLNGAWEALPTRHKRGMCVRRRTSTAPTGTVGGWLSDLDIGWLTDYDIPIFRQDRGYIEGLLKREMPGA